jgi:predicted Rossmann fold flavoprotein
MSSKHTLTTYDVIVIGGGTSGLMATIAAAKAGARVLLVDKGDKLGRKLGISGGGRCNVTNAKELDELIKMIPGNGRFLYSALTQFGNTEIIQFFENLGIQLKEEDHGRMFPVTDKAKTVVDALIRQIEQLQVDIVTNEPVLNLLIQEGMENEEKHIQGIQLKSGKTIRAKAVIVAVGGKSVPHTGSTGDGYAWAEQAGHTITTLFPTEVPLTSREPWIVNKSVQGVSLRNVALSVWQEKASKQQNEQPRHKWIKTHQGDMIFTHFGISGPATLRCSQYVVKEQMRNGNQPVRMTIDFFPEQSLASFTQDMQHRFQSEHKKAIKNVLRQVIPEKIIPLLLTMCHITESVTYDHLPKQSEQLLYETIKAFPIYIHGTRSIEEAFITGGGVNLKEIDPKSMQSKYTHGLYFCGEILDIHGYTGGYNITAAFSTGHAAGTHAGLTSLRS